MLPPKTHCKSPTAATTVDNKNTYNWTISWGRDRKVALLPTFKKACHVRKHACHTAFRNAHLAAIIDPA
jgi:hypothetical protein